MVSNAKKPLTEKDRKTLETRGWLSAQPSEFRAEILAEAQSFSLADGENIYSLEDAATGACSARRMVGGRCRADHR